MSLINAKACEGAFTEKQQQPIRSTIPARLDRLRRSPFHTRLVLGLGTAWSLAAYQA